VTPGGDELAALSPRRSDEYREGVLLTLAYDGAAFAGFAPQANARTVASVLMDAIRQMDPDASSLRVASRTDSGVHARGQVACFDTTRNIPPRGWLLGLSGYLPPQIAVQRVARVDVRYNPSKRARGKTYSYSILQGALRDPFLEARAWRIHERLDIERMRSESQLLLGTHDFIAFRGSQDQRTNTIRTMRSVRLEPRADNPRCLVFEIQGDRFMFRMVRIIVGTLVDVGRGNCPPGAIQRALQSRDRNDLGMTAPPDGLFLEHVELDDAGRDEWPDQYRARP
jgi:tRNA pseudouridine38-40 synthase